MIYLDHNATTPLDPRVLEGMMPWLTEYYGNPSSLCRLGRLARAALDRAREQVARLVGVQPHQVIFTSGATEASNLALSGVAMQYSRASLVAGATEHPAVRGPLEQLAARRGWPLRWLRTRADGTHVPVEDTDLEAPSPVIAALMRANNETGVIEETRPFSEWVRARGGFLHVDAVQAAGKIPLDFAETGAHALTLSAHKMGGPKGVGALIIESGLTLAPLMWGGSQERGLRPGTESVAQIVGFGLAAEWALQEQAVRADRWRALRARLEAGLQRFEGCLVFGEAAARLPNTCFFSLSGWDGEALVMALDRAGFCVSSGSACASAGHAPSPVLLAMGVPAERALGAVRVSLGAASDEREIEALLSALAALLGKD